jgi:tetrahydromethanopterin S-methyltransferase subunit F
MAEEETKAAGPIRMAAINEMMRDITYKSQILARTNKLESGIIDSGLVGLAIGLLVAMVLVIAPAYFMGMV